jgi:hypothetical protein
MSKERGRVLDGGGRGQRAGGGRGTRRRGLGDQSCGSLQLFRLGDALLFKL